MKNDIMNKMNYGEELTLKEQTVMLDDYLYLMYEMLCSTFPDLKLQCSGSALHNDFSIMVDEGVKLELLSKAKIEESINECSGCGREFSNDIKKWHLESFIKEGKSRLQSHDSVKESK